MKTKSICKIAAMLLLTTFAAANANAQSSATTDSICSGSLNKIYKISGLPGSTFTWTFSGGGTKTSGGTTDSITVNWSATPGIDTLTVVEANTLGCLGDPVKLVVVRLAPPTVVLSGTDSICLNSATTLNKLEMNFTGYAPWSVQYTEAGTTRSVITSSTKYNFNSQVFTTPGVKGYVATTLTDRFGCTGTYSGTASVTVFPKPTTSAIIHY
ncbi:MAG: hypothetical protein H7296_03735 [Bacteroidia bacterium]|nr:hypothetical protein [Bacteroidia bacterium]